MFGFRNFNLYNGGWKIIIRKKYKVMGFGTWCTADLYFSHVTYRDRFEVEDEIKFFKEQNDHIVGKIKMLAAGNPKDLLDTKDIEGVDCDPIECLDVYLARELETLKENTIEIYKLELLLENFDTRGGDFVNEDKLREELMHLDGKEPYVKSGKDPRIMADSNNLSNGID